MGYLYRHIRLDKNEVFYIGIGGFSINEKKNSYKRAYTKFKRNKIWNRIIDKTQYTVEIILDDLTWEEACKKEIEFIKLYGRKDLNNGTLANLTDGGDGSRGIVKSKETLIKLSKSLKGRLVKEETREKIRIKNTGKFIKEETREKLKISSTGNKNNLGKKQSDLTKKKISNSKKGKIPWNKGLKDIYSEESKMKMSIGRKGKESPFKGKKHTDESKEKNRLSHLGKSPNRIDYSCSEETKIKIAENMLNGKKIQIDGILYNSYVEAEKSLCINNKTIRYRVNSNSYKFENYKLVDVQ